MCGLSPLIFSTSEELRLPFQLYGTILGVGFVVRDVSALLMYFNFFFCPVCRSHLASNWLSFREIDTPYIAVHSAHL